MAHVLPDPWDIVQPKCQQAEVTVGDIWAFSQSFGAISPKGVKNKGVLCANF